ncbi:MAG: N-acetylornithine carbamoyltransferase [Bacteroidota bacterium]
MKHFTCVQDVEDVEALVQKALTLKASPWKYEQLGRHKTLVLLFFNPSLRTRLSSQKAGQQLGLSVITMDASSGWKLEFEDHITMNTDKAEHIKEAAAVISGYADLIGIRSFPALSDKAEDYQDRVINSFRKYASVPVISLESAIRHPLQSLADLMTITEHQKTARPKVVLSWAPHPKLLPQAVANSFAEWLLRSNAELVITHPKGYELDPAFTQGTTIEYDQKEAFSNADFIYVKNWSSVHPYGQQLPVQEDWRIDGPKMNISSKAQFMHCLPIRRNVVATDKVLDSPRALHLKQAKNRTFAAQAVFAALLE